jgi:hypothetical protein
MADGPPKPTVDWRRARSSEAGYADPMASPRFPLVLALEVYGDRHDHIPAWTVC